MTIIIIGEKNTDKLLQLKNNRHADCFLIYYLQVAFTAFFFLISFLG